MNDLRFLLLFVLVPLILIFTGGGDAVGTEQDKDREKQVADRFWNVLLRSPRRGAAFDRVYGYYVDSGEAEMFLKKCEDLVASQHSGQDAAKYRMLLGLVYQRRIEHEKAVEQFEQAALLDSDNALASYYLAEQYIALSRPQEAIQALEESIRRNPSRIDLREILFVLVQTTLRSGNKDKALLACCRLEQLFHDDLDLSLQLARLFTDTGHWNEARSVLQRAVEKTPADESDVFLLEELVETSYRQADYAAAVRYQERVCQRTRLDSDYDRLFLLYDLSGERDKASRLLMTIVLRQTSLATRLESVDRMIRREEYASVDRALSFLEIHETLNWAVPYRRIALDVYEGRGGIDEKVRDFRSTDYQKLAERNTRDTIVPDRQSGDGLSSQLGTTRVQDAVALLPAELQEAALRYSVAELHGILERQKAFLVTLFPNRLVGEDGISESRTGTAEMPFLKPESLTEARFFVLAWLLKSAGDRDKDAYHHTLEKIRAELPSDSPDREILLERIQLEWLIRQNIAIWEK